MTQWTKRYRVTDENMSGGALRTGMPKVERNPFGHRGQQRQVDGGAVLLAPDVKNPGVPIDVINLHVGNLSATQPVCAKQ
jgi:hypothetical protein